MARTRNARKRVWPHRVIVVSLLLQNPTAVEPKETTADPAPGVTTWARSRCRRRLATVTAAALPEEILVWEVFVRLPAKYILRCRAVCRYWCGLTSSPDFLLAHHRRQPSLLLLTRHGPSTDPTLERGLTSAPNFPTLYGIASRVPIFERGLNSTPKFHLALAHHQHQCGNPVLGFDDYDGFKIHASCDGLLLLSLSNGRFSICNPATRQCDPLPCLTAAGHAALYLHRSSGEYRVLYWNHLEDAYYILMVGRGRSPRRIGVPSDTPGIEEAILAWNETTTTNLAPPVVFRNCLHWDPSSDAGILVFDTVVESFRLMRGPADATRLCTRLCDMEGSIGFSCFGDAKTVAKIWVLEDYEREVWSLKYHVKIPVCSLWGFCNLEHTQHLVLSDKGDVLVYDRSYGYMFHCDNTGKLLEEFQSNSWSMSLIGPWFKESLVTHDFFLRRGRASVGQLRFFERV